MSENPNEGRDGAREDEAARDYLAGEDGRRANPDVDEFGDQATPEGDRSNRRMD